jgi:hypothetical protein
VLAVGEILALALGVDVRLHRPHARVVGISTVYSGMPSGAYGHGHAVDSIPWKWMLPIRLVSSWWVWPWITVTLRNGPFPLAVPPLRERAADIGPIAADFLDELHRTTGRGPWTLTAAALRAVEATAWPGNVRELRNVLERATIISSDSEIDASMLRLEAGAPAPAAVADPALPGFADNERRYLAAVLDACGGKIYGPGGAAERAGLNPSTLRSKLVKHGLR